MIKETCTGILKEIAIENLSVSPFQPRKDFPLETLKSLAETIKRVGILEPLLVRKSLTSDSYQIIAGERRWRDAQIAGLSTVPCLIKQYTDEQSAQISIIENVCREALDPISQAQAIKKLIEEFDYTHEAIGEILGLHRTAITNSLRLLTLDVRIQAFIKEEKLSETHGQMLAGIPQHNQYPLAHQAAAKNWSSRQLERAIKELTKNNIMYKLKKDVDIAKLEQQLSEKLGCSVIVGQNKKKKPFLTINFSNLDQMQDILEKLGYKE